VVYLKGLDKAGSGFFVTGTGLIVTNAHVARGEESLLAVLTTGEQLETKVVYIDPDLDIALAKVDPPSANHEFPHLTLITADGVRQGEAVLAIGNPGDAMLFSVTRGIVSAVGRFSNAGPGTWVQTDAPINPGNSGGPLLNFTWRSCRHQHAKTDQEKRPWYCVRTELLENPHGQPRNSHQVSRARQLEAHARSPQIEQNYPESHARSGSLSRVFA
jgi:hypothetical protein